MNTNNEAYVDSCCDLLQDFDDDLKLYFQNVIAFLTKYEWIYDFKITDIFSLQIPKKVPLEWSELRHSSYEDLNKLMTANIQESWPQSLKDYVNASQKYCLGRNIEDKHSNRIQLTKDIERGISDKKKHEITRMAKLINHCGIMSEANFVLDVGAGLGYLDQVVHYNFGYQIIGLETVDVRMHKAEERASKQGCKAGSGIVQKKMTLTEEITNDLLKIIDELKEMPSHDCNCRDAHAIPNNGNNIVMTGLHCCGDLTPCMIKMFVNNPDISCLCCVGCCYHFMSKSFETSDNYKHFPMSESLKNTLSEFPGFKLSTYALRLASQETKSRWLAQSCDDHEKHIRNVGFRAVLQVFADRCDIKLKKRKRRGAKLADLASFDDYIKAVSSSYNVTGFCGEDFQCEMKSTLNEFKDWFSYIEFITALQVMMQPVLESLLIIDRYCFLLEHGLDVQLIPVFNDYISPRNMAIIAFK